MTQLLILTSSCGGGAGGPWEVEDFGKTEVKLLTDYIEALDAGNVEVSDELGGELEDLAKFCTMDWEFCDTNDSTKEMLRKLNAGEMVAVEGEEGVTVFAPVVSDYKSTRDAAAAMISKLMHVGGHPWDEDDDIPDLDDLDW